MAWEVALMIGGAAVPFYLTYAAQGMGEGAEWIKLLFFIIGLGWYMGLMRVVYLVALANDANISTVINYLFMAYVATVVVTLVLLIALYLREVFTKSHDETGE